MKGKDDEIFWIFIYIKKDHTGIEPVTYRSAVDCSTTELITQYERYCWNVI